MQQKPLHIFIQCKGFLKVFSIRLRFYHAHGRLELFELLGSEPQSILFLENTHSSTLVCRNYFWSTVMFSKIHDKIWKCMTINWLVNIQYFALNAKTFNFMQDVVVDTVHEGRMWEWFIKRNAQEKNINCSPSTKPRILIKYIPVLYPGVGLSVFYLMWKQNLSSWTVKNHQHRNMIYLRTRTNA